MKTDRLARRLFVFSCVMLAATIVFAGGWIWRDRGLWPQGAIDSVRALVARHEATGLWGPDGLYLAPPTGAARVAFRIPDPARLAPGYRAIMAWDEPRGGFSIRLFDATGAERHHWMVSYPVIRPGGSVNIAPHGMVVRRDGSVVVSYGDGGEGVARLDVCGRPVWVRGGVFHHLLHADDDGAIWSWFANDHSEGHRQHILRLDPDSGETLADIDLVEDVVRATPTSADAFGLPRSFAYAEFAGRRPDPSEDIFHANDVEPLPAALAPAFPMFRAGDLLISLRNLNMVAVLDPETKRLKWWRHGPWRRQHDPDFGPDGRIWMFNNNPLLGRSDVTAVDPATGAVARYFSDGPSAFYSETQGALTVLPGGAVQVVAPDEGRVLEIARSGETLLEYNDVVSDRANARVLNATWLPPDYFDATPTCPAGGAAG